MSDKTEREQLQDWLRAELDSFIEWPGDDMTTVTTASALLFAEHVIGKFKKNHIEQMVPEGWVLVPVALLTLLAREGLSETESDRYVDAVMDARDLLAQRERGGEV